MVEKMNNFSCNGTNPYGGTHAEVGDTWFFTCFGFAILFLFMDATILFVVLGRRRIAMRHDTISSYLGSGTDGARLLIVSVTMTTWAVMALHFSLWIRRENCGDNDRWASWMIALGSLVLTVTLAVPGGKYYEAAVLAKLDIEQELKRAAKQNRTEDIVTEAFTSAAQVIAPQESGELSPSTEQAFASAKDTLKKVGCEDEVLEKAFKLLRNTLLEGRPHTVDNPLRGPKPSPRAKDTQEAGNLEMSQNQDRTTSQNQDRTCCCSRKSTLHRTNSVESNKVEVEALTKQLRLLLPPDDAYFADGHLCVSCIPSHDNAKDNVAAGYLLKITNKIHMLGVLLWILLLTPPEVWYIYQNFQVECYEFQVDALSFTSCGKAAPYIHKLLPYVGIVLFFLGFVCLFSYAYVNVFRINPLFKPTKEETGKLKHFIGQNYMDVYLAEHDPALEEEVVADEEAPVGDDVAASVRRNRLNFRWAVFFEGMLLFFIWSATLTNAIGRYLSPCDGVSLHMSFHDSIMREWDYANFQNFLKWQTTCNKALQLLDFVA